MVTFTGITKILDFGVAHSSACGSKSDALKGKFPYMAPERIKSRTTDRRTDVYSLGVLLYLLFTGQLPFTASSDVELLKMICTQAPRPPSELCLLDPRIEQIILRAMQPDADARHQTVSDMLAALSPCLDGQLGTYGQQDVARFVTTVFAAPTAPRALPAVPDLPHAGTSDVVTGDPSARYASSDVAEIGSLDIEVESAVLDIPREPPRRSPLTSVFAQPSESRTSVQSLFGERPSRALGHVNLFDRAPSETTESSLTGGALGSDPGRRTPDADPDSSSDPPVRGVFGGYTSSRPAAEPVHWPWPSSRMKSK
jgi:serine/threonine protein kinase